MGFWDGVTSIVSGVGKIADGIVHIATGSLDADNSPADKVVVYQVGDVKFYSSNGHIWAENLDRKIPVLLNFVKSTYSYTDGIGSLGTSAMQKILGHKDHDCKAIVTDAFTGMSNGTVSMNAALHDDSSGNNDQSLTNSLLKNAVSFSIRMIGTATAISIVGGVSGSFKALPKDQGYKFIIESTGLVNLISANISLKSTDGSSAKMKMSFEPKKDSNNSDYFGTDHFGSVDVPAGVNLKDMIAELDIVLELETSSAKSFFEEVRQNTVLAKQVEAA